MTDSTAKTQPDSQPEQQPDRPAETRTSSSESSAASKLRSPVERAIVWGVISVLVVMAVLEARARFGFKAAYDSLQDGLQQGELAGKPLAGPKVTDILKGRKPDEIRKVRGLINGASRVDIYRFRGVLQKRMLYVYYGIAGQGVAEVLAITDEEAEKFVHAPPVVPRAGSSAGQPGEGTNAEDGRQRPAGEKTKSAPAKKRFAKGGSAPKKSKAAPVETKSTPSVKKK